MRIVYLIGNGFDINIGIKSRYSDFYKYYKSITSPNKLITTLKEEMTDNHENWSDMELALGKYTEKIISQDEFDKIYIDLEDNLAQYLQNQEESFDYSKLDQKKFYEHLSYPERLLPLADRNKISEFRNKWKSNQWITNIITFNYTKSLEKLAGNQIPVQIGTHNKLPINLNEILHIHGDTNNSMVMGVNDISQIANTSFHDNQNITESLIKDECNKANRHLIDTTCKKILSAADLICIFGSSIGKTDNIWWEMIGEQLTLDNRLIIFRKGEDIPTRRAHFKNRNERKIINNFLSKTKLSKQEKEKAEKKIIIGLNTKMFSINN